MKNFKLNVLEKESLSQREMNDVKGGDKRTCNCSCYYADMGGSNTSDNLSANFWGGEHGLTSAKGEIQAWLTLETVDGVTIVRPKP